MSLMKKSVIVGLFLTATFCSVSALAESQAKVMFTASYQHAQMLSRVDNPISSTKQNGHIYPPVYPQVRVLSKATDSVMYWNAEKAYLGSWAFRVQADDVVQHMNHLHIQAGR